jgi:hypothetical protein
MGARLETLNLGSGSPCRGNGYHGYGLNNLVPELGRGAPDEGSEIATVLLSRAYLLLCS